jgi:hypothetical protein
MCCVFLWKSLGSREKSVSIWLASVALFAFFVLSKNVFHENVLQLFDNQTSRYEINGWLIPSCFDLVLFVGRWTIFWVKRGLNNTGQNHYAIRTSTPYSLLHKLPPSLGCNLRLDIMLLLKGAAIIGPKRDPRRAAMTLISVVFEVGTALRFE